MRSTFSFLAAVAFSTAAFAQQDSSEQDHAAHHPAGASAPAPAAQKPRVKGNAAPARPKSSPAPASGGMGMAGDMRKMHDRAHEPGGMHDQMHGKDKKMMGGPMSAMPAASAASQ
jgi:hypothetical protein